MEDTVTIDNFQQKLPEWDPRKNSGSSLFALVDMGSNGIRFSISDLAAPRSRLIPCIYTERAAISLYDALHREDGEPFVFPSDTIALVASTLARFREISDRHAVPTEQIMVFATEAMRTAKNQLDMLAAIQEKSGLSVRLLSPEVESLFGAMGARSGFHDVDGLFLDLGGGSVQMTYVNSRDGDYAFRAAQVGKSIPSGAAKLTAAMQDVTATADPLQSTFEGMQMMYNNLEERFPHLKEKRKGEGISLYLCGGGLRGYGSMLMHLHKTKPYPIQDIGGFTVTEEEFLATKQALEENSKDINISGLSKRRRAQFRAIIAVVEALIHSVRKIKRVVFCRGGNREGALFMRLPRDIRESNPFLIFTRSLGDRQSQDIFDNVTKVLWNMTNLGFLDLIIFTPEFLHFVARSTWDGIGEAQDRNAARALHEPISGRLGAIPGLTHEMRIALAVTLSTRWNADLGPRDKALLEDLKSLQRRKLGFHCGLLGGVCRFLAVVFPVPPVEIKDMIRTRLDVSPEGTDKKGPRLTLHIKLRKTACSQSLDFGDLEDIFKKAVKGNAWGWRVKASIKLLTEEQWNKDDY